MGATLLGWVLLTAVLILAVELGYRLHSGVLNRSRGGGEPDSGESGSGYVLSAALGLLGLLIAFVFSMANDRYVERRQLVAEANAISTAVARYQSMPEPHRSDLLASMAECVKVRLQFYDFGGDMARVRQAEVRAEALQARIWRQVGAAVRGAGAAAGAARAGHLLDRHRGDHGPWAGARPTTTSGGDQRPVHSGGDGDQPDRRPRQPTGRQRAAPQTPMENVARKVEAMAATLPRTPASAASPSP